MYLGRGQEPPSDLGDWYNNWGDLWGDIRTGAQWLSNAGHTVTNTGNAAQNAANNIQNATSWRLDGFTVVAAVVGVGAVWALTRGSRR